jgi:hypothetical protein
MSGLRTDMAVGDRLDLDVRTSDGGVQRVEITVDQTARTHTKLRIVASDAVVIRKQRKGAPQEIPASG